jgi:hypothetical protein
MKDLDLKEPSAKQAGETETLREVPDDGPTLAQIVFAHLRSHCEAKTGAGLCPVRGRTREGFCVGTYSACPHDERQPDVSQLVEAPPSVAKASAPAKK